MVKARVAVACLLAAVAAALMPVAALAHALPQSAIPPEGSTVQQAPSRVEITFGEAPDVNLSSITVVTSSGQDVDAGPTVAVPGNPVELQVPLRPNLPNGVYTVTWKTVSSVDGHLATGSYAFGVGVSAARVPATSAYSAPAPSVPTVLARLLLFVGLIVVLGAAVLSLFAFGAPTSALRWAVLAGAVLAAAGTAGVIAIQAQAAGVSLTALFSTSLGRTALERGVPALVMLGAAIGLRVPGRVAGAWLAGVAAAASLAAMAVDALSSHAGAQNPVTVNEIAQWLHIAAVGVWIGGLVALLVSVLTARSDEHRSHAARRLSRLAGIGLVVVAATGVFRAVIEVQAWGNLVSTAFGQLVLLKIALLVVLAMLGAVNRYGNLPRLPRSLARLRRLVSTEVLVALGALTVAAALVNVAPPAEYAAAAARQKQAAVLVVSGADAATTVRVRLTVTPGTAGFNTFSARVTDFDTGAAIKASAIVLQFTQPFRPQLGASTLTLHRQRDGTYAARAGDLSLAGVWQVAAIVEAGERSTEVHMVLMTREPQPAVQVTPFGNGLTVYTVQLASGNSAQVYLDPDRPGADEFHVTFIGANGNELPIATASIGMTPQGGTPTLLASRRLDPVGHFVADATVPSGQNRFDIIATTTAGQTITTYVILTLGQ